LIEPKTRPVSLALSTRGWFHEECALVSSERVDICRTEGEINLATERISLKIC
jgi:hypothetical protein